MEAIQKEIEHCEKNSKLKDLDKEYQLTEIRNKFSDVKFEYPSEFIMNTHSHLIKFPLTQQNFVWFNCFLYCFLSVRIFPSFLEELLGNEDHFLNLLID